MNLLAHSERVVLVGVLPPQMMVVPAVKYNSLESAMVDKQVLRSVLKPEERKISILVNGENGRY